MKNYRVVEAQTPEALTKLVAELVKIGWLCQGGVCVIAFGDDSYLYVQALIYIS